MNSLTQWWWAYYLAEHIIKVDKNLHDQLYYQYRQLVNQTKEEPSWGWVGANTCKFTVGLNHSFGLKFWWFNSYQVGRGQIVPHKLYHIKHKLFAKPSLISCQFQFHVRLRLALFSNSSSQPSGIVVRRLFPDNAKFSSFWNYIAITSWWLPNHFKINS